MRLFSPPSEPSVAGMLILSGVGGLVLARPQPTHLALAAAALALHLFTFDPAFNAARARRLGPAAALAALNAAPYAAAAALWRTPLWPLALAAAMVAAQLLLHERLGARHPLVYIYGASIPVLPALTLPALAGALNRDTVIYWGLLTAYAVATAAYVETRLPWRSLSPLAPLALWLPPAAAAAAAEPATIAAAAEPTATMALNALRNRKIDPRRLRRFGWITLARLMLFNTLLLAALLLA